jgi:hypothetical protein
MMNGGVMDNEDYPDKDQLLDHLMDHVYDSAYWATEHGATKEALIEQIHQAFSCAQGLKEWKASQSGSRGGHA